MISGMFAIIKNDDQRNELSEFYAENADRFIYIALSKLHNEHDAEDAVQTAFVRIADKPENFFSIPPHARIAYVDIMIRNIAIDMYNRRSKVAFIEESEDDTCNEDISLEDIVVEKISKNELLKFIESLPQLQRDVLTYNRLLGFSISDTAQRLNISCYAVKKRLYLARKAILKFVNERCRNNE